jgi:hypothetical protein
MNVMQTSLIYPIHLVFKIDRINLLKSCCLYDFTHCELMTTPRRIGAITPHEKVGNFTV